MNEVLVNKNYWCSKSTKAQAGFLFYLIFFLIITATIIFAMNSNVLQEHLKRHIHFLHWKTKWQEKKKSHWREKPVSNHLLTGLLEYIATVLQRCRYVSLVICLKYCGEDFGFHMHIWLPKNQWHCPTSDGGNRYNKANGEAWFPWDGTPFPKTALMICHMLLCCQLSPHQLHIQAFILMCCKEREDEEPYNITGYTTQVRWSTGKAVLRMVVQYGH